jgi:hypothetical protein
MARLEAWLTDRFPDETSLAQISGRSGAYAALRRRH